VDPGAGGSPITQTTTITVAPSGSVEGSAISVTADNNTPPVGQAVNFTASVTPVGATGSVGFAVDSSTITNTVPLDVNSTAKLSQIFTTAGQHTVAVYYIDSAGNIGVKNFVSVTVGGGSGEGTAITVTADNSSPAGRTDG
jgi:hypothetical protein